MQIGLILISLAFPLLELAVLIKVGQAIGFWWTMVLLAGMAVAGGALIKHQGLTAAQRGMQAAREGRAPIEPVIDSMLLVVAGALLMLPGLISDVLALLLLVPPLRRAFARWGLRRVLGAADIPGSSRDWRSTGEFRRPGERPDGPRQAPDGGIVIDGEWERVDERKPDEGKDGPKGGSDRPRRPPTS